MWVEVEASWTPALWIGLSDQRCHVRHLLDFSDPLSPLFVAILSAQWMKNLAGTCINQFFMRLQSLCACWRPPPSTITARLWFCTRQRVHSPSSSTTVRLRGIVCPKIGDHKNQAVYQHVIHFPCFVLVNIRLSWKYWYTSAKQQKPWLNRWNPLPASQRDVLGHFLLYLLKSRARGIMVRDFQTGLYLCTWGSWGTLWLWLTVCHGKEKSPCY